MFSSSPSRKSPNGSDKTVPIEPFRHSAFLGTRKKHSPAKIPSEKESPVRKCPNGGEVKQYREKHLGILFFLECGKTIAPCSLTVFWVQGHFYKKPLQKPKPLQKFLEGVRGRLFSKSLPLKNCFAGGIGGKSPCKTHYSSLQSEADGDRLVHSTHEGVIEMSHFITESFFVDSPYLFKEHHGIL